VNARPVQLWSQRIAAEQAKAAAVQVEAQRVTEEQVRVRVVVDASGVPWRRRSIMMVLGEDRFAFL
jgi:hypothetical protein